LPQEMTFVSVSEDCENVRGTVACAVGRVAVGASIARKIVVRIEHSGKLCSTAPVRSEATAPSATRTRRPPRPRSDPMPTLPTDCRATPGSGEVIEGTRGDDVLRGTPGDDIILGFGGDDAIDGGTVMDKVYGEGGHDALDVSDGTRGESASGAAGTDTCFSGRATGCL
jgi:hypothetical protein